MMIFFLMDERASLSEVVMDAVYVLFCYIIQWVAFKMYN